MTPQRAQEIFEDAKAAATYGPWSDRLKDVMTPEENKEILAVWATMPGHTCYVHALFRIMNGESKPLVDTIPG